MGGGGGGGVVVGGGEGGSHGSLTLYVCICAVAMRMLVP